jgi:hypothetical protein
MSDPLQALMVAESPTDARVVAVLDLSESNP